MSYTPMSGCLSLQSSHAANRRRSVRIAERSIPRPSTALHSLASGRPMSRINALADTQARDCAKIVFPARPPSQSKSPVHAELAMERRDSASTSKDQALREQRQWFEVTLSCIGDGVITTDTEGNVTFLNSVAEKMTGWATREAQGCHLEKVFPIIDEDTRAPVENPALLALKEGVVYGLSNHTLLITKDGREIAIDDSGAPIVAGDKQIGAVLVFRDTSERRQAERARALLAKIVESSEDAIVSKTLDGIITSWNAAAERMFEYTAEEAVGKPITIIIPKDRLSEEDYILGNLRQGKRIFHMDTIRVTKSGKLRNISLSVSPVRDGNGKIIGASKIARDITERVRAERELQRLLASESAARAQAERKSV